MLRANHLTAHPRHVQLSYWIRGRLAGYQSLRSTDRLEMGARNPRGQRAFLDFRKRHKNQGRRSTLGMQPLAKPFNSAQMSGSAASNRVDARVVKDTNPRSLDEVTIVIPSNVGAWPALRWTIPDIGMWPWSTTCMHETLRTWYRAPGHGLASVHGPAA